MRAVAGLALAAALASACGGGPRQAAVPGASPGAEVRADAVPPTLLGLGAREEDVSHQLAQARDRAFVSHLRLWSLREGERLRATIEVARFSPDATPERESFRRQIVAQIGQSAPRLRRVEGQDVYVTTANRQALYVWFRGLHFLLLSTSVEYRTPRALLREAIRKVRP